MMSYRYGFNGKEMDNDFSGGKTGAVYDYGFRIYDSRIAKFLSVDPLTKDYPGWSPYPFAMNRVIDGIDLDGLEYLDSDVARIKMRMGEAHINIDNLKTKSSWTTRDRNGPWPSGNIGWPTKVGALQWPDLPEKLEAFSWDNTLGANDPNYNPTRTNIEGLPLKKDGTVDQRSWAYKYNKRGGVFHGGKGFRGMGGVMLAVNAISWAYETYGSFSLKEDMDLVEEHTSILQEQVMKDINIALNTPGMIPRGYRDLENLGNIANVVLSGVNPTDDPAIYKIGINIVKEISKNLRKEHEEKRNYNYSSESTSGEGHWISTGASTIDD